MPHTHLPLDCHCNSGVHGQYRRGMNGFTPWQFTRRDTSVLLSPFSIPACQHAVEGVVLVQFRTRDFGELQPVALTVPAWLVGTSGHTVPVSDHIDATIVQEEVRQALQLHVHCCWKALNNTIQLRA